MTTEGIFEAALKLPDKTRARLVSKLLDSFDEHGFDEATLAGAKVAEQRLRELLAGNTPGIPEKEAHRQLFDKKKP